MSLFKDFENNYDSKNIAIRTPNYTLRQASSRLLMQWTPIDCYRSASIYKLLLQLKMIPKDIDKLPVEGGIIVLLPQKDIQQIQIGQYKQTQYWQGAVKKTLQVQLKIPHPQL